MKRTFTKLMAALMLLLFIAPLGMMGQSTYTIGWGSATGTSGTYTNFTATSGSVNGILSFSTAKNGSSSAPAYNENANELRLYYSSTGNGGSITITPAQGITITGAVMTTSTTPSVKYTVDGGTATSVSASDKTYTVTGISATQSLKFQNVNTSNTQLRILTIAVTYSTTYTVTYDCNGGTSGCPSNVTSIAPSSVIYLAAAPSKTGHAFDGWSDGTSTYAAGAEYTVNNDVTMTAQWTAYTITAQSNNDSYGTVSLNGFTITASPLSGCRYASPAYSVSPDNSAEVTQSGNTFTVTPTANTTVTINFEVIPTHTATFSVNGSTSTQDFAEGATITFPANPADTGGKTFVGWTTTTIDGTTDEAPTMVNSAMMGNSNVTFYAVFATVVDGGSGSYTLDYNQEPGLSSATLGYGNSVEYTATDGSTWIVKAHKNEGMQINTGKNSSIKVPDCPGNIMSIAITCSANKAVGFSENDYNGSGTITYLASGTDATSQTLDLTGKSATTGYIVPKSGSTSITKIVVNYASVSITGYCTTVGTTPASYINLVAYHESYQNPYLIEFPEYDGDVTWNFATVESNLGITDLTEYQIQFYDEMGAEIEKPDWIMTVDVHHAQLIERAYDIDNIFYISARQNTGPERTTFLKVWANDADNNSVYSSLVTVIQPGVPQDLTVTLGTYVDAIYVFNEANQNEPLIANGEEGTVKVAKGTNIIVSPDVAEGFVLHKLMVGNEDVTSQIDESGAYTFPMPSQVVAITATAKVAPGDYVRITSLDQLKDGCKVIIAARYDNNPNHYCAMKSTSLTSTSGKAEGEQFTSTMSGTDEILPDNIANTAEGFYWTVSATNDGFTFTNYNNQTISYGSSANFNFTGNYTTWTVASYTASSLAMVGNYNGYKIVNVHDDGRAFALNTSHNFGPYSTSNMNASDYNFSLDFFVQGEAKIKSYYLNVNGYNNDKDKDGYCLIASPVTVNPKDVEGLTDGDFDLYYFDQSQEGAEWRNYEAVNGHFKLVPGTGYLYAKKATQETSSYNFTLTGLPYDGDGVIELTYTPDAEFAGWNLVGNPFGSAATISKAYYAMNALGRGFEPKTQNDQVAVMQGVFVYTEEASTVTFTKIEDTPVNPVGPETNMIINITKERGTVIDRAIVRFGQSDQLPKFMFNPNASKLYIPQGNKEFAVVNSTNEGEMPVNFKAAQNGTYTFSVEPKNVEMTYLHLIDNMTGADVDLLATPSYTFEASNDDYASRFRLVFKANADVEENTATETFAYFNGTNWTVSNVGDATLQVVDMMGRVLSSETISGNAEVSINQPAGIYMLRLVNGENVKVQKVVVR